MLQPGGRGKLYASHDRVGPVVVISTVTEGKDHYGVAASQGGEVLFRCKRPGLFGPRGNTRNEVNDILGTPRTSNRTTSTWLCQNITDVNLDWKPHARVYLLVVEFDEEGRAARIETDQKKLNLMLRDQMKSRQPKDYNVGPRISVEYILERPLSAAPVVEAFREHYPDVRFVAKPPIVG